MNSSSFLPLIESEPVLVAFHRCLNSVAYVPATAYRRNSNLYPLVSYTNNLVGALLSENYEAIALFIARAAEHMAQIPASNEAAAYYALVSNYLAHVAHIVESSGLPVVLDAERIPNSILSAGPQQAPNPSINPDAAR